MFFFVGAEHPDMKIRGRRECTDCGRQWSYYETGSVTCPDCGSIQSVGIEDERKLHTASTTTLDLTPVRAKLDSMPLTEVASEVKTTCRTYARESGFLKGGELLALSEVDVAARELVHVADVVGRTMDRTDDEEWFFLSLLGGADEGDRPAPSETPTSLREARGLAAADVVSDYRSEMRAYLDETPQPEAAGAMERLDNHVRRIRALQGDIPPADAERLVAAARDLGAYLRTGNEDALALAYDRLDALE